ncbi:hypothetical protein PM8797T_22223 [Gimesia maris DSM 8797]|nr:hypothetical protein PM8797T_22223 [Gimesia maris DSM 8797]
MEAVSLNLIRFNKKTRSADH